MIMGINEMADVILFLICVTNCTAVRGKSYYYEDGEARIGTRNKKFLVAYVRFLS